MLTQEYSVACLSLWAFRGVIFILSKSTVMSTPILFVERFKCELANLAIPLPNSGQQQDTERRACHRSRVLKVDHIQRAPWDDKGQEVVIHVLAELSSLAVQLM